MIFVNCTPHTINLNDGNSFEPSGVLPRVASSFTDFKNGICQQVFGELTGLPEAQTGTVLIVSAMVLAAASDRDDLVAPSTGHPGTVRNDRGHIVSVPGFVK